MYPLQKFTEVDKSQDDEMKLSVNWTWTSNWVNRIGYSKTLDSWQRLVMATETKNTTMRVKSSSQDVSSKPKTDPSALIKKKVDTSTRHPPDSKMKSVTTVTKSEVVSFSRKKSQIKTPNCLSYWIEFLWEREGGWTEFIKFISWFLLTAGYYIDC